MYIRSSVDTFIAILVYLFIVYAVGFSIGLIVIGNIGGWFTLTLSIIGCILYIKNDYDYYLYLKENKGNN